jgi:hypothetical protein
MTVTYADIAATRLHGHHLSPVATHPSKEHQP